MSSRGAAAEAERRVAYNKLKLGAMQAAARGLGAGVSAKGAKAQILERCLAYEFHGGSGGDTGPDDSYSSDHELIGRQIGKEFPTDKGKQTYVGEIIGLKLHGFNPTPAKGGPVNWVRVLYTFDNEEEDIGMAEAIKLLIHGKWNPNRFVKKGAASAKAKKDENEAAEPINAALLEHVKVRPRRIQLNKLKLLQIQREAERVGVSGAGSKPEIIMRIVEHEFLIIGQHEVAESDEEKEDEEDDDDDEAEQKDTRKGSRERKSRLINVGGDSVLVANNYSMEEGISTHSARMAQAPPKPKGPLSAYNAFSNSQKVMAQVKGLPFSEKAARVAQLYAQITGTPQLQPFTALAQADRKRHSKELEQYQLDMDDFEARMRQEDEQREAAQVASGKNFTAEGRAVGDRKMPKKQKNARPSGPIVMSRADFARKQKNAEMLEQLELGKRKSFHFYASIIEQLEPFATPRVKCEMLSQRTHQGHMDVKVGDLLALSLAKGDMQMSRSNTESRMHGKRALNSLLCRVEQVPVGLAAAARLMSVRVYQPDASDGAEFKLEGEASAEISVKRERLLCVVRRALDEAPINLIDEEYLYIQRTLKQAAADKKGETRASKRWVTPAEYPAPTVLTEQPDCIANPHGMKMRDYQLEGLSWLITKHDQGINQLLGDEMGLGKTLQTISLLGYLAEFRDTRGPHLIIVPLSVLSSWCTELRKWCPEFRVVKLHSSSAKERDRLQKEVLVDSRNWDVVVTTYEMTKSMEKQLKKHLWQYIVVDEAHVLKNEEAEISRVVSKLKSVHIMLLTGTPLQNNLHELWALLKILHPDVFDTKNGSLPFDDCFDLTHQMVDKEMLQKANLMMGHLMKRRVKSQVESTVPPKEEMKIFCPLTALQRFWIEKLLTSQSDLIMTAEKNMQGEDEKYQDQYKKLNNLLMQLRKVCNHPYQLPGAEPDFDGSTDEDIVDGSGKLALLDKMLPALQKKNHRCVLFSQFTQMLDILEDYLIMRGYEYARLDGSTNRVKRTVDIAMFNAADSKMFIFLLSTRAGGLGVNLQTADTAIMYDSDWNPQVDLQAMARVHRIGQTKKVHVYRLLTRGTVEERILERAEKKVRSAAQSSPPAHCLPPCCVL